MIYGAILAGGTGKRMEKQFIPKQFIAIGGTPIIVLTISTFLENKRFSVIYIAVNSNWKLYLENLLEQYFSEEERSRILVVNGGKERLYSFINIMEDIIMNNGINDKDILICHDSVRPFVQSQIINDCIDATLADKFALTVIPTADTIHVAYSEKYIDGTLERKGLYNGQTPSGFNIKLLKDAIELFSEEEKDKVTGTTQLILRAGHKIRIVKGHTQNFKITTDNDLNMADSIMQVQPQKRKIELLDCTLRDGGIVVNFDFGVERMQQIKVTLEESRVEYIECGYINENKGKHGETSCFVDDKVIRETFLSSGKKKNVKYLAMIDYGTFDVRKLGKRSLEGIDGIRLAFHKENWKEAIICGKIILNKGYDLYIQPMLSMRYTDDEYIHLINICNVELKGAKGFYIVDSFGQMDSNILLHFIEMADQYVASEIKIGFHAHNNRQTAYSNAVSFLTYRAKHDVMIDSSIMGMGKGAGNLCTELIMSDLMQEGKMYNVTTIYDSISEYFTEQQKLTPWGYSLDYYLSSLYSVTPSYINIFLRDKRVTTDVLIELLDTIPEEKKAACNYIFAEEHLKQYWEKNEGI